MFRKVVSGILLVMLVCPLAFSLNVQPADASDPVYIESDGSIDPSTANIQHVGNLYTFTNSITAELIIQRDNVVVDGGGYSISPKGLSENGVDLSGRFNVTLRNIEVQGDYYHHGICLDMTTNCTLIGNNVTCEGGIGFRSSFNNVLRNNKITSNGYDSFCFDSPDGEEVTSLVNDVDTSNTVNGKPIYYWIDRQNASVPLNAGFVMLLNCSQITMDNLTLTGNSPSIMLAYTSNSDISNCTLACNDIGVYILSSSRNTIGGNNLTRNTEGIVVFESSDNRFSENTMIHNAEGIILISLAWPCSRNIIVANAISEEFDGIEFYGCSENLILGNNLTANNRGINCAAGYDFSLNNTIFGNTVVSNDIGILIHGLYNVVSNNNITRNNIGIKLLADAAANRIHSNEFVYNTRQVVFSNWSDEIPLGEVNIWDDGYPSGGNYWSDYNGNDSYGGPYQNLSGSDGIGDSPYFIDANNTDHYPLVKPTPQFYATVTNKYATDKLFAFFNYLFFEIKYPLDCVLDVYIQDYSEIRSVYIRVTGLSPSTINLQNMDFGHFRVELKPSVEFSPEDLRDAAYTVSERLFDVFGIGSLAPAPWSYSEPPDYYVTVDELVFEYQNGTEYRRQNPITPRVLPTYKDVLESLLPIWGRNDIAVGTLVVAMCPVDVLVTDSQGRRVGSIYENGRFLGEVNEIPNSFYSGINSTPELILIPDMHDQCTVQVDGYASGHYILDVLSQVQRGSSLVPIFSEFSSNITNGEHDNYQVPVLPEISSCTLLLVFVMSISLIVVVRTKKIIMRAGSQNAREPT